jgi:Fe-S cluster biogenesis protein NfuA
MFIQTEDTPNPNSIKFIPGVDVSPNGPVSFSNQNEASKSPLANNLFALEYVDSVFLGTDFITVTKKADIAWEIIKPELLITIMEHFISGQPTVGETTQKNKSYENASEVVQQIIEVLDQRIRPAVAMDGGDIEFHSFEDGIVYLKLKGACSGCPSSSFTLKEGVENTLKHYVPEVMSVEAI